MDLADFRQSLQTLLDNTEELQHALGAAGKEIALDEIGRVIGQDRIMSGFGRKVTLNAGYDLGTPVVLNLRPAGLWILADEGRKRTKRILPKGRGRKRKKALATPQGARAASRSTPSRGLRAIERTVTRMETTDELTDAVGDALETLVQVRLS